MPKVVWVVLPLLLYAAVIAFAALRGRAPSRLALNIQTSMLLIVYLLSTAGLGVFWVANQQLPVFDWHYLFGYATLLLVSLHLSFNLPVILRWLRRKPASDLPVVKRGGAPVLGKALAVIAVLAAVFFLGMRHGASELSFQWNDSAALKSGPVDAVIRYHEFSSESRSSVFQRAPGVEWGTPPAFKHYPGAPKISLERGKSGALGLSATLRKPAPRGQSLRLAQLGEMLYLSSGITERRGGHALRAAPSSGALFPSELYVLARAVDGLPAGVYHYDPEHHRLDALGKSPAALGATLEHDSDAVVVLTSVFGRTGYKYRNRAYRYAVADAGHLLENLRLASHAAGMQASLAARYDEMLIAGALGVDGSQEGVLAMMVLGKAGLPAPAGEMHAPARFRVAPVPADTSIGVTGIVQQATSLRLSVDAAPAQLIALPAPEFAAKDVHETIVNRRSKRRFLAAPLPLASLSSILADLALPPQLSDAIGISLIVNRVTGLQPGVYRYLPQHALQLVRAGEFADAARAAALAQDVIGDAAVALVLSVRREQMLAEGARGYRHAFLEAGMVGERWLLSATARGLAACPVGAFYDDEAASLIGVDRHQEWVLHFAALGLPSE